ncbi:pyridoxal phosphate-dependent aminotransferase [Limibaculum sp. FT325]|uniref:pyridoxal phosphate-dependent aminotransferase n=1 Tax=Thermohalobaculum sediminis TaxID=2939436 RepID=UPI0020BDCA06|nr:pyridoxal phosphate-dependent aminotransferase [Limibaculum sediminis]MCL5775532.1 pyridoxal phosphate-dependent aminotransferase [Limibaculum sediminis]
MTTRPLPPFARIVEGLPATVPFVGPEQQERDRGRPFAARIGANESVFGPSPRAVEAIARAAQDAWMYGDPSTYDLRGALAAELGVEPANLVIGEGIDGLLGLTVRLFANPGDVVVTSAGAYPTFNYHVAGFGARLVTVPYRGDAEDPEALAAAAREHGARLVYLANPDNPMGSWHGATGVERLIDALPEGCVLCLDEAYVEFAPAGTAPALDVADPRVIRFRTFSKAHGLAGLRVGYAIAEARLAAGFERIRNHFGVGRVAQAGAVAALADRGHLARVVAEVEASRAEIARIAAANGLAVLPSATNFVAIDCGGDGALARAVLRGLVARDVFVRMPGVAPLDRCIRVSCGRTHDLALLEAALPAALAEARAALR